jgi:hypothetical protein
MGALPWNVVRWRRQYQMDELTFVVPHRHEVSCFQGEQLRASFRLPWVSLGTISEARFVYEMG